MTLITILIALLTERYLRFLQGRQFRWFLTMAQGLRKQITHLPLANGPLGVLIVLAPILLGAILVTVLLAKVHGVLVFLFSLWVLYYCLCSRELREQGKALVVALQSGDQDDMDEAVQHLMGKGVTLSSEAPQRYRQLTGALLAQSHERLFAILFWFAILGPLGALLYRFSCVLRADVIEHEPNADFTHASRQLHALLGWLPTRLLALSYGIAGSFTDTVTHWRRCDTEPQDIWRDGNDEIVSCAGIGAMQLSDSELPQTREEAASELNAAMELIIRTLVVWVTVVALLTLVGWAA